LISWGGIAAAVESIPAVQPIPHVKPIPPVKPITKVKPIEKTDPCAAIRNELANIFKQLEDLLAEKHKYEQRIEELRAGLANVDARIAALSKEINPIQEQIDALEADIQSMDDLSSQSAQDMDTANPYPTGGAMFFAGTRKKQDQDKINDLKEQLRGPDAEREGLERQKANLEKQLDTAEQEFKTWLPTFQQREAELRRKYDEANKRLAACQKRQDQASAPALPAEPAASATPAPTPTRPLAPVPPATQEPPPPAQSVAGTLLSWTLTVTASGSGSVHSTPVGISCGDSCSAKFPDGATVTLWVQTPVDLRFAGWGGPCSGSATCRLQMVSDLSVTANFVRR